MPKLVYHPDGVEPHEWDFDPYKLLSPECMAIERVTGLTFEEWVSHLIRGSMVAVHAALWVLLRRDDPGLDPDDVVFTYDDFDVVPDPPVKKAAKKAPKAAPTPSGETTT